MKKLFTLLVGAVLLATWTVSAVQSQEDDDIKPNVQEFMRVKLLHSQKVLEGLATEDYDMIAKHAQEMSLISRAEEWQVFETPDYLHYSEQFRRAADSVTKAAKEKNLDAATLGYVKMTTSCVECHKHVRLVREARLDRPLLQKTFRE
ncbi:hypothetical protein Pan97_16470 [Bremerella volcania]|uniref:Cytochrome C n=1 Tax=Bremerella volcania TaxID=2527984 RepID=A0A518C5X5_9BACT|nr:hypothetical protein [Bremerella volcania]QDU74635.1 hypothetical protein Pan97_16470 [Bremerella volcania]